VGADPQNGSAMPARGRILAPALSRPLRAAALALALLAAVGCGERTADVASADEDLPPEIEELLAAAGVGDFETVRGKLEKIDRDALSDDRRALVDRIESQMHSAAGDPARALESLERALDSGALSPDEASAARFDKAWLYNATGQPERAIEAYAAWQAALGSEPSTTQLLTIAEAHAAARDCRGAAALIAKAYAKITLEERVDVAAALETVRPLCPGEAELAKYGDLLGGSAARD
jgi:hypothetical protein